MKHLINLFTTIGMVVTFLTFIALACYIHDAIWTAQYPSTREVAHGGWPNNSKTEATWTTSSLT